MRHLIPFTLIAAACSSASQSRQLPQAPPTPSASEAPAQSSCQPPTCQLFDSPEDAFRRVLTENPLVLGIGEFHTLKTHDNVPTPVSRFAATMLPQLRDRATDIVVELWDPPKGCKLETQQVEKEQRPATDQHPDSTPNEFLQMGLSAKKMGIFPHPLSPSCDDFQRVLGAGDDKIHQMLMLTNAMMRSSARKHFEKNRAGAPHQMVVTYSGAMHNDIYPDHSCGAPCSFGSDMQAVTQGRYVELDLVVPEYIHDGAVWKDRSWYPRFNRSVPHPKTMLFNLKPGSFVLIFPTHK